MGHPLKTYWRLYGGVFAFANSLYLLAAAILALFCYPLWAKSVSAIWPDISISILPSLMGFSIAAMAVVLAFSDAKSMRVLTQNGRKDSYFVKVAANLFHFLVVQVVALVLAILAKAHRCLPVPFPGYALSFFGLWALFYAVFVSVAAAGQLLNTATIINKAVWTSDPNSQDK